MPGKASHRQPAQPGAEPAARGGLALLAMVAACSAVFLTALDQTVVVTALPSITSDLQIPLQQLDRAAWVISAYLLGYVIAMPLMGRVSDLYGRRLVFVICLSVFGVASLVCGLATALGDGVDLTFLRDLGLNVAAPGSPGDPSSLQPGLVWLVAARFVQAAGGGAIVPVAMAVAGDYYGERQRALALGLVGMVTEAGGVLGPLYGAAIIQAFTWHMIFFLNVPLVILLIVFILLLLKDRPAEAAVAGGARRLDLPGTLLLGASLICLSLGLSQEAVLGTAALTGTSRPAPVQNNPVLLASACVFFLAFAGLEILVEQRATRAPERTRPIVEPSLFTSRAFCASALVSVLVGASLIIAMADIPLFIATVLNGSALDSGLALLRLTVMIPIGALAGGWLCSRLTCRLTALAGLILAAAGFGLMHLWPIAVDLNQITLSTLTCGLGFGLVIAPISTTAMNAVRRHQMGMGASVVTVLRMTGMILGLAGLTSWGLGRFYDVMHTLTPPAGLTPFSPAYVTFEAHIATIAAHDVFTSIFLAAGVLCLVALPPAFLLEGRQASPYAVVRARTGI